MNDLLLFLGYGGACAAAGATGVLFRPGRWYAGLEKPSWTPPNIAFPIVWTTLYVATAWAAWRVGEALSAGAPEPLALQAEVGLAFWTLQITLNALWSPIFFGLHRPGPAFAVICVMAAALGLTVWGFAAVDVWAAAMMVPTLIWGIYAASLNLYVALLNPPEAFGPRGAAPDAG